MAEKMKTETSNIDELLVHILSNRASQEEIVYFSRWVKENRTYFEKFKKVWHLSSGGHAKQEMLESGIEDYRHFMQRSLKSRRNARVSWRILSSVAVLVIGVFIMLRQFEPEKNNVQVGQEVTHDKRVLLTFSDGKKVNVLSDSLGLLDGESCDIKISKTNQREIVYEVNDSLGIKDSLELIYNQIIVPAGERFSLQLSDGTKVWVNSESSLRYPVRFGNNRREVEVRGNVYFEVKKDTTNPFIVISPKMITKVLGTRFEVNTYEDQNEISATLVEGSVEVNVGRHSVIIKPDQQIVFNINNGDIELFEVDAANRIRWKDGVLVIDNEQFDNVVWKLERWYGVSIENRTGMQFAQSFSGEFDREDIRAAIETLCMNLNISFMIERDRVVLKK